MTGFFTAPPQKLPRFPRRRSAKNKIASADKALQNSAIMNPIHIPLPTLRRLPLYLRLFREKDAAGKEWLSSEEMAAELGFNCVQIRKDLGTIGAAGIPKRGFPISRTAEQLSVFLTADGFTDIFVIGSGSLCEAVISDPGITSHGFHITAVFDPDPEKAGSAVGEIRVLPMDKLPNLVERMGVKMAVLAVGEPWLAEASEIIAQSALCGILNLSGSRLDLPSRITVVSEDFGAKLASLAGELTGRIKR